MPQAVKLAWMRGVPLAGEAVGFGDLFGGHLGGDATAPHGTLERPRFGHVATQEFVPVVQTALRRSTGQQIGHLDRDLAILNPRHPPVVT